MLRYRSALVKIITDIQKSSLGLMLRARPGFDEMREDAEADFASVLSGSANLSYHRPDQPSPVESLCRPEDDVNRVARHHERNGQEWRSFEAWRAGACCR